MAPHQPIRFAVMGWDDRPPTPAEMDRMRALTRDWMEAGAVGLNTGLDYQPAANASTDELVELAKVVAEYGGVYAAHIRYNEIGKPAAYRESIEIGTRAGVPIRQSHESVDDETEPLLEEARQAGVDFGIDWYLYPAGSSHLLVWLPPEDQLGGFDATVKRLRDDPAHRAKIARDHRGADRDHPRHRRPRVLLGHADRALHRDVDRRGRGGARHEPR